MSQTLTKTLSDVSGLSSLSDGDYIIVSTASGASGRIKASLFKSLVKMAQATTAEKALAVKGENVDVSGLTIEAAKAMISASFGNTDCMEVRKLNSYGYIVPNLSDDSYVIPTDRANSWHNWLCIMDHGPERKVWLVYSYQSDTEFYFVTRFRDAWSAKKVTLSTH